MYELGVAAPVVLGSVLTREVLPDVAGTGPAVHAAQAALAFTGIAAGVYVAIALALIVIGMVLRHWGTTSDQA